MLGKPRARIPQDLLDSVEEWLLRAEIRDQASLAAATAQPAQNNPNKTMNAAIILTPFKKRAQKYSKPKGRRIQNC